MSAVREFFVVEATECLSGLEAVLRVADNATVNTSELLRLSRMLRGSAQMAREDRILSVAQTLEAAARALVSRVLGWNGEIRLRLIVTVEDLRFLVQGTASPAENAARASAALNRWRLSGVQLPAAPTAPKPAPAGTGADAVTPEFLGYAAREVSSVLVELEAALSALSRDPRDREPLKAILRRQRALLGSAQLDSLPAIAESLRTLDEVTRLVARRDVAVEGDWFAVYRHARDALAELSASLLRGDARADRAADALRMLRASRAALLERFDASAPSPALPPMADENPPEVVNYFRTETRFLLDRIERMAQDLTAAGADRQAGLRRELRTALSALRDTAHTFGFGDVATAAEAALARVASGAGGGEVLALLPALRAAAAGDQRTAGAGELPIVPVETLCFRGEAALRRALELRPAVEGSIGADPALREVLGEVFDLIRQGLS